MNKIKTIIFDMDGTTLDTLIDLADSVNYVLTKYNMPTHERYTYRQFFGNGIKYALKCATPENTPDEVIDKMLVDFKAHYNIHCLDHTCPYDGIIDVLKELKRQSYKIAIVSNKIDSAVQELHEKFFKECVDISIGEKVGINRKPAPDMVLEALRKLGSNQKEAVYVGDSEVDYQTSVNSRMPCILVLWGFRDKEQLLQFDASFADTPKDIINELKR